MSLCSVCKQLAVCCQSVCPLAQSQAAGLAPTSLFLTTPPPLPPLLEVRCMVFSSYPPWPLMHSGLRHMLSLSETLSNSSPSTQFLIVLQALASRLLPSDTFPDCLGLGWALPCVWGGLSSSLMQHFHTFFTCLPCRVCSMRAGASQGHLAHLAHSR